ncbi:MAG: hypothetical protein OEV30_01405 [Ignavibacteria bacterium]|nr:hypothetical protein [Ignavibacteria bacterium]
MNRIFDNANRFFDRQLTFRSRLLVLLGAVMLIPTFFLPLWHMTLYSNQFPEGLRLSIHSHTLEGEQSKYRNDLEEINALNHYIGMRPLVEEDFTEFKWIPFVLGGVILLSLRVIVLGNISKLVDLTILFTYFGLFSLWSFQRKLYLYGHELDPTAAVTVDPFTPPMIGHQTLANFEVYSFPGAGSYFMALAPVLFILAMWLSREAGKERNPASS